MTLEAGQTALAPAPVRGAGAEMAALPGAGARQERDTQEGDPHGWGGGRWPRGSAWQWTARQWTARQWTARQWTARQWTARAVPGPASRGWAAAFLAGCGVYAAGVAVAASSVPQRAWGLTAAAGYGLAAAVLALAWWASRRAPRRAARWASRRAARWPELAALAASAGGAVAVPLTWLAATGQGQPEVSVIVRSASLLLHHGSPYLSPAAIAASGSPNSYNPYLPALAVFGIPRALGLGGLPGDPRLWFGAFFTALLTVSLARIGRRRALLWALVVLSSPAIAFPLVVGGDDLPPLALLYLSLALLHSRSRPGAAGLTLGLAAAMKATAWPALPVVAALIAARDGRRALIWFTAAALAVPAAVITPFAAAAPGALVANTILFPLGMTRIKTDAASMLPGHLIGQVVPYGRPIAVGLLLAAGLAMAGWLARRPPRDAAAAAGRLAVGLAVMFTLAPATRFGYFAYPLALAAWAWLVPRPRPRIALAADRSPARPVRAAAALERGPRREPGWGRATGQAGYGDTLTAGTVPEKAKCSQLSR
jgi:Glycosyltransferase family 87